MQIRAIMTSLNSMAYYYNITVIQSDLSAVPEQHRAHGDRPQNEETSTLQAKAFRHALHKQQKKCCMENE